MTMMAYRNFLVLLFLSWLIGAGCNLAPENSAEDIVRLMTSHSIRHIPVVRDQQLIGVISILDLVRSRVEEVETDYGTLRTFMSTRIE